MDVSDILDGLNNAQREAVAAPVGNTLVLAGAGSGKTRVLVHRIAWLLQVEGVSPHGFMAVTFTNKAAKEMRLRIEQMLGIPTRGLWIGTFHGLAHRFLKQHYQEAKLPKNFQILDSDDQTRLIKRLLKENDIDDGQFPAKKVQYFINAQKDEGLRAEHIDQYGDAYHQTMRLMYSAYQEACQRAGMVDFAEILLRSHELWREHPQLLQQYQKRFGHILVDEFQDTNAIQYAWLRMLCGKQGHLMAVGDDDQSIYGWRGAKIENIQHLENDFSPLLTVRLEQNYRSTRTILQASNAVIDNNSDRLGKELWSDGEQGEMLELYAAFNEHDEARYTIERIRQQLSDGQLEKSDMAILYRSNAQSRVFEESLIRSGLPYRIYGGQRFYERLEIRHALAYLRLLQNPYDDAACDRVINVPPRGIGLKSIDVIRALARDEGCSLWQAIEKTIEEKLLPPRALGSLSSFLQMRETWLEQLKDAELDELIDQVVKQSGLPDYFAKEKSEKAQTRLENLQELVNAGAEFNIDDDNELSPLQQFLDTAALDAGDGQADEFEDSIQLMTLHSAKGLEFKQVYLVGLEEGLFPHNMSLQEPGRLEEERRLCYVGMTRAKERLFLSYAEARRLHGTEQRNMPSRFLREIPADLIKEVRLGSSSASFAPKPKASHRLDKTENLGFQLGQRVQHAKFGQGVLMNVEGQGAAARVQVNFDEAGSKWLVLQFANLQGV